MEPGFGQLRQARQLIDSSFFRVYTDPSKPPVIGDLAGLQTGLARSVALSLPRGGTRERSGSMTGQWHAASTNCSL